ncbi:hypothetical protein DFQ26_000419 [Actinomortierella ambigua]|nr:hypothetical protein DFQ26_000419 [Actinomortierella ambigua]
MFKYTVIASALVAVSSAYNLITVCNNANFQGNCVTWTGNLNTCYGVGEYNDAISSANIFGGIVCRLYRDSGCRGAGPLITGPAYNLAEQNFNDYSPIARSDYLAHQGVLKRHNIGYYAYGATASGLLTGKHRFDQEPSAGTCFSSASRVNGGRIFKRYWHHEVFAAVDLLKEATAKEDISLTEAMHRWLRHHSGLSEGDAVLVGVSSLKQLEQNLDDLEMGPLPADLVDAFEKAWKVVEHLQIISISSALDKEC